jgi:hypothetical protein
MRCAHLVQNYSTTFTLVQKIPNGGAVGGNKCARGAKMLNFSAKSRVSLMTDTQTEDRIPRPTPPLAQENLKPWAVRCPPTPMKCSINGSGYTCVYDDAGGAPLRGAKRSHSARFQIPHSRGWRPERTQECSGEALVRTRGPKRCRKNRLGHHRQQSTFLRGAKQLPETGFVPKRFSWG